MVSRSHLFNPRRLLQRVSSVDSSEIEAFEKDNDKKRNSHGSGRRTFFHRYQIAPLRGRGRSSSTTIDETACDDELVSETLQERPRVSFTTVSVRNYELILGDNPEAEFPLSLGWDYDEESPTSVSVDEYDARHDREGYKNSKNFEPLSPTERKARLEAVGLPEALLMQQERSRRVRVILEFAYRCNQEDPLYANARTTSIVRWLDRFLP